MFIHPAKSALLVRLGLWIRRSLLQIADRIVPVQYALFERSIGLSETMMISVVCEAQVPELVSEGPISTRELARLTQMNADVMHRILRALSARGIFHMMPGTEGLVSHTRLSRGLLNETAHASHEWAQYFGSVGNVGAWADLRTSLLDGRSAFDRVFGETVWEWFAKNPAAEENFAQSMMGVTRIQVPIILDLYDFSQHTRLCDVGGGRGTLLSAILRSHLGLRAILCDGPGVLSSAESLLAAAGVRDRVELIPGNFFKAVPEGADCYLLKNILHDWNDDVCIQILKTVYRAMQKGQTLVVIEQLIEPTQSNALASFSDIQMLVACSDGRERSSAEIEGLLKGTGFAESRTHFHPITCVIVAHK